MSDTTTCSSCGTEVPSAAAFCTGCGQPLRAAAAPPADPPPSPFEAPVDPTRVETPGLNDVTQVAPPPPPPAPAPADPSPYAPPPVAPLPPADGTPPGPWGPSTGAPATEAPANAPWNPPAQPPTAPPPASTWQQTPPPGAAAFTSPASPPVGTWGTTPGATGPAWGEQPAAPAATGSKGSILGGLVGLVGSVLAIVGIFSGWVKLGSTGTVTAWSLTAGEGLIKTQTPYVILALAAAAVLFSLALFTGIARTAVRLVTALLGIGIIAVTAVNWAQIAAFITDNFPSSFEANTAIGFYFTIAGGVLVIIAALLPAKK